MHANFTISIWFNTNAIYLVIIWIILTCLCNNNLWSHPEQNNHLASLKKTYFIIISQKWIPPYNISHSIFEKLNFTKSQFPGVDHSNKAYFATKANFFWEYQDGAGSQETLEFFSEMWHGSGILQEKCVGWHFCNLDCHWKNWGDLPKFQEDLKLYVVLFTQRLLEFSPHVQYTNSLLLYCKVCHVFILHFIKLPVLISCVFFTRVTH